MNLHNLIDRDIPSCLYCDYELKLTLVEQNLEKLLCLKCNSIFEIYSDENFEQGTKYVGFLFSCKSIYVMNLYATESHENVFHIGNHQLRSELKGLKAKHVTIPAFTPDFSNKEKLFEKLKLLLLFS